MTFLPISGLYTSMRILFLLILLPTFSVAQNSIVLGGKASAGMGWWSYKKGLTEGDTVGLVGYGRSHASLMRVFTFDVSYNIKKVKLGFAGTFRQLYDSRMIGSMHSQTFREIYPIGDGTVDFYQVGLNIEYLLVKKQKHEFGPRLELGYSSIRTLFDFNPEFDFQGYWSFGFAYTWWFRQSWGLALLPTYSQTIVLPKNEIAPGERHDIYGVLLGIGINYKIDLSKQEQAGK